MSANNNNSNLHQQQQRAMLVDTTKVISSTNSAALVVPMQSNPSLVAPGGKWYMVYVPPGGVLPSSSVPASIAIATSDHAVAIAEATSSSEPQSEPQSEAAHSQNAQELPRRKRAKAGGKTKRAWGQRSVGSRQSQVMPRPTRSFYQPNFSPQGYQPRPFCPGDFH